MDRERLRRKLDATDAAEQERVRLLSGTPPLFNAEDDRLQHGAQYAYEHLVEWRPIAEQLIKRRTRIKTDPTPRWTQGSASGNQIFIGVTTQSIGEVAEVIVHESIHIVSGIGGLAEEIEAHCWSARAWLAFAADFPKDAYWQSNRIHAYRANKMRQYVLEMPWYRERHKHELLPGE